MNAVKCMQSAYGMHDESIIGCDRENMTAPESVAVDIRVERLRLYATHLETLLMRKNGEIAELQSVMEQRVEEMHQKQSEHEHVVIHQARHAAMGEMLGTIAHQWRQPLHVISLTVQNLKDARDYGEFTDELLDSSIDQTMEQVMLLSRTIDNFRTFLNPVKTTEYFDPIQCVEECVGLLSGWFSKFPGIEMRKTGDTHYRIAGCHTAFKQVVLNILNNANDAVQERQRRIGPAYRGSIVIDFRRNGDDAVIGVADNGGGIDETVIGHIFEPYFTTKSNSHGIGIGLYVSRLIVENSMNGSLLGENIPDGAYFAIRLPVAKSDEVCI